MTNTGTVATQRGSNVNSAQIANRAGLTIQIRVLDSNKQPLPVEALVRITSEATGVVVFGTTRKSEVHFENLPAAKYLVEAGAAGYLGVHLQIPALDVTRDYGNTFLLARDPSAVDLTLKKTDDLPSRVRKEAEKGAQALGFSNFEEARKHLEAANRKDPSSSSINFLLGYLALQQKEETRAQNYLETAVKLDPQNLQAQNLLGQIYSEHGDYARAAAAEALVVAANPDALVARKVLANAYLHLQQYEKSREQAQWIVNKGGTDAADEQLVLGQALAGSKQFAQALQALNAYLSAEPASSVASLVREQVARITRRQAGGDDSEFSEAVNDPSLPATATAAPGNGGMPADIDTSKPQVAPAVQCPNNLFDSTAARTRELVNSVAQFSAIEDLVHESLSPQGAMRSRETRRFNYLVSISEPEHGLPTVQEYRDETGGAEAMPDHIATTGLAVLELAFHPQLRDDFEMTCEGLGTWGGQPAWVIHFRQRTDKPSQLQTYIVNGNAFPVALKGRAWFTADTFQPLHLDTDLVAPILPIQLLTEHTSIDYGPVVFQRHNTDLWLPRSANLYVHLGKKRFHRTESFDHFMLFSTDATDKPSVPKSSADAPATPPARDFR